VRASSACVPARRPGRPIRVHAQPRHRLVRCGAAVREKVGKKRGVRLTSGSLVSARVKKRMRTPTGWAAVQGGLLGWLG
jgi:hypothetical protein